MPGNSSGSDRWPARFGRTVDMYGDEGFARIRAACVAVLGMGGVGSHCAVTLACSGRGPVSECPILEAMEDEVDENR